MNKESKTNLTGGIFRSVCNTRMKQKLARAAALACMLVALFAALVLFPFFADQYWIYLACLVAIHIVSTTGLNILTGYTGLVSLGQAAFMSVGAYTVAILEIRVGTPFIINLIAAGFVSARTWSAATKAQHTTATSKQTNFLCATDRKADSKQLLDYRRASGVPRTGR